jgi:recombination protein RecR
MTSFPHSDRPPAAEPVVSLIEELAKLPGIGPKTAQRLTYHLVRMPASEARALAEAIVAVKELVGFCSACWNITDRDPCAICASPNRDRSLVCVVEDPLDVMAVERAQAYRGLYHVLHGVISPMNGVGPDELRIKELLARLHSNAKSPGPVDGDAVPEAVQELILATNPTLEGEATAIYLQRLVAPLGIRVTRLARGLATGGELEYADELTLTRAFEGRQEFA